MAAQPKDSFKHVVCPHAGVQCVLQLQRGWFITKLIAKTIVNQIDLPLMTKLCLNIWVLKIYLSMFTEHVCSAMQLRKRAITTISPGPFGGWPSLKYHSCPRLPHPCNTLLYAYTQKNYSTRYAVCLLASRQPEHTQFNLYGKVLWSSVTWIYTRWCYYSCLQRSAHRAVIKLCSLLCK